MYPIQLGCSFSRELPIGGVYLLVGGIPAGGGYLWVASDSSRSTVDTRCETPEDGSAIRETAIPAFQSLAISHAAEHRIIESLREAGSLAASLVADNRGRVIGYIACSPVSISDGTNGWHD